MNLHEYQAKALLKQYHIPIPKGMVAATAQEAAKAAEKLAQPPFIIKAQIHAGARGKGGGIRPAAGVQEAEAIAADLIGARLATPQTGPEGKPVNQVLVEESLSIAHELYLSIMPDRRNADFVIIN